MSDVSRPFQPRMPLTDREMEVLNEIRSGKPLREASRALRISENTVKNHLRNIIEKLRLYGGSDA